MTQEEGERGTACKDPCIRRWAGGEADDQPYKQQETGSTAINRTSDQDALIPVQTVSEG